MKIISWKTGTLEPGAQKAQPKAAPKQKKHENREIVVFSGSAQEALRRAKAGSRTIAEFQAEGQDLSKTDLSGLNFLGANMKNADLRGSNLKNTNLGGFRGYYKAAGTEKPYNLAVDMEGADLRGADLTNTDLSRVNLKGADLRGAKIDGTDFEGADLTGVDVRGMDTSKIDFGKAKHFSPKYYGQA